MSWRRMEKNTELKWQKQMLNFRASLPNRLNWRNESFVFRCEDFDRMRVIGQLTLILERDPILHRRQAAAIDKTHIYIIR